jgi:hypothetical protein
MKNTITQRAEDYILNLRDDKDFSLSGEELVTKLYTEYLKDKFTPLILSVEDFSLVLLG